MVDKIFCVQIIVILISTKDFNITKYQNTLIEYFEENHFFLLSLCKYLLAVKFSLRSFTISFFNFENVLVFLSLLIF